MAVPFENMRKKLQKLSPLNYSFDDDYDDEADKPAHPLDTPESQATLAKLSDWWSEAKTMHSDNRYQQSIDADFFDGLQWSDEDARVLRERGQMPLVFNKTAQHINWLCGTERRTRVDFKVHGRSDNDVVPAESKTKLLKYVTDVNKTGYQRSKAFADCMKVGVGWMEDGIRSDPHDEPAFTRHEHWRCIWWDALAKEDDLSDARYLFRVKYTDEDYAIAMFPDREQAIKAAALNHNLFGSEDEEEFQITSLYQDHTQYGAYASGRSFMDTTFHIGMRRSRVKLIECWYRQPVNKKRVRANRHSLMTPQMLDRLDAVDGQDYTGQDMAVEMLMANGYVSVYDALHMEVRCAIFVEGFLLQDMASPYKHNRFPFTPIWAYRRDRDGMPYGPIRNMRDPQDDLNKRRSKALFLLSTNQIIADEDAFEDWDEAIDEVARPDGVLKKRRGAEVEINRQIDLAKEHVELMQQDIAFLESTSGVTEENLGEVTNTNSGKAINLRQNQGSVVTAVLFDNLRRAIQQQGENLLSLVEQFYTEPKKFRIVGQEGLTEFVGINQMGQTPEGGLFIENDIHATTADFVVDAEDFSESVRLAMFDKLMEMTTRLDPEVTMQILDVVIDLSDLPKKEELVKRIRKMNGQIDPDAPNRAELEANQAAAEDEEKKLVKREREAEIRKAEATASQAESTGRQRRADVYAQAVEIAAMLAENPQLAMAVDILSDSINAGNTPEFGGLKEVIKPGPTTVKNPLTPDEPTTTKAKAKPKGKTNGKK